MVTLIQSFLLHDITFQKNKAVSVKHALILASYYSPLSVTWKNFKRLSNISDNVFQFLKSLPNVAKKINLIFWLKLRKTCYYMAIVKKASQETFGTICYSVLCILYLLPSGGRGRHVS